MHPADHHHDCGDLRFRRGSPYAMREVALVPLWFDEARIPGRRGKSSVQEQALLVRHVPFEGRGRSGRASVHPHAWCACSFPAIASQPWRSNHSAHGIGPPLPPVGTGAVDSSGMVVPPSREGHVFFSLEERWRLDLLPKGGIGDRCSDRSSGADGGWKDRLGP